MASRKPSYRRHRDYIKSFKWTYDLEKDLYECYTKFKLDPRIGYMNRIKQFWDGKHPELNLLTSKNLRGHVSSIIKRKVFTETDLICKIKTLNKLILITATQQLTITPLLMTL